MCVGDVSLSVSGTNFRVHSLWFAFRRWQWEGGDANYIWEGAIACSVSEHPCTVLCTFSFSCSCAAASLKHMHPIVPTANLRTTLSHVFLFATTD